MIRCGNYDHVISLAPVDKAKTLKHSEPPSGAVYNQDSKQHCGGSGDDVM